MQIGSLAEWAIALAIFMHVMGAVARLRTDTARTELIVIWVWLVCGVAFVALAVAALILGLER